MARLYRLVLSLFRRLPVRLRRAIVRRIAPSYTVGAICAVERSDGRVLLVRHSYRNRWGMPGGLLGRGEVPEAAVVREAAEEVGLNVEPVGRPTVVVDAHRRRVDVVFRCRLGAGDDPDAARPCSPEIVETQWFSPTDLPELQFETAGALRAVGYRVNPSG